MLGSQKRARYRAIFARSANVVSENKRWLTNAHRWSYEVYIGQMPGRKAANGGATSHLGLQRAGGEKMVGASAKSAARPSTTTNVPAAGFPTAIPRRRESRSGIWNMEHSGRHPPVRNANDTGNISTPFGVAPVAPIIDARPAVDPATCPQCKRDVELLAGAQHGASDTQLLPKKIPILPNLQNKWGPRAWKNRVRP